jgi:c-di-GMP-binding flagellar brake protein YcgR
MTRLLPSVGDELLLSVPQTEQVLARVDADGPGFFDLALLERPETPQPTLERIGLTIEFINDDGVARMHGRLDVPRHRRGYGRDAKGTVRFAHRGSPQLLRRREFVRATVDLALTLWPAAADQDAVITRAHAIDLSGGGMLVKGLHRPHLDESLRFALDVGDGAELVRGTGRVVRLETQDRVGIRFVEVDPADCTRLQVLAFEMSREQRRRFA